MRDSVKVIDYDSSANPEYWLEEIGKSDWRAGRRLQELIKKDEFRLRCGSGSKILLLADGDTLLSFCTYAKQDEIRQEDLMPWIGFVYTFPQHRGHRYIGKLLDYAYSLARKDGYRYIYISTEEIGLYEKYGYVFWKMMKNIHGEDTRVYRIEI